MAITTGIVSALVNSGPCIFYAVTGGWSGDTSTKTVDVINGVDAVPTPFYQLVGTTTTPGSGYWAPFEKGIYCSTGLYIVVGVGITWGVIWAPVGTPKFTNQPGGTSVVEAPFDFGGLPAGIAK